MRYALQAKECVIAVEDNKPEAYQALIKATQNENIDVALVPTLYPQGSEKQLIKVITDKECPSDGLPLQIGVVVHNVGTAAAVYRAISLGEPLISRIVTITGDGVREPKNLEVLLGTPMQDILNQCGGLTNDIDRVIMGGPMMGFAMHNSQTPIIKTTNCILAATHKNVAPPSPVMPCVRCGACANACPVNLLPQQLYWHARAKEFDKTNEYNLFDCIECGCCAHVCPSNIPLVHYYRYAKTEIWAQEREKEKSDIARQRHEFRQERIDKEKAEKAARSAAKKAALKNKGPSKAAQQAAIQTAMERAKTGRKQAEQMAKQWDANKHGNDATDKQNLIKAAMERTRAKKEVQNTTPKNTDNLTAAQQKQIDQTDAHRSNADKNNDNVD
jgi:electron transport complex protein RnfC